MGFTTPCFIRKNTQELRKKLEELGYKPSRLIFDSKGENPRMIPGKWHGKFPKRQATDSEKRIVDRNGRF